jgi:hypothetical protein
VTATTFDVRLVCPGGGPDQLDLGATFSAERLPREGDEIEVIRGNGAPARAVVRLVEADSDTPITAALLE